MKVWLANSAILVHPYVWLLFYIREDLTAYKNVPRKYVNTKRINLDSEQWICLEPHIGLRKNQETF